LKDHLVKHAIKSMTSLDVCKMKIYCSRKLGVKVDQFLKIVWKISNLDKSKRLIYKIQCTKLSYQWSWNICHVLNV